MFSTSLANTASIVCLDDNPGECPMDTNTLLIIVVLIFLFGGFGFYGRGRWF
jgi:hypothetical protein